MELNPASAFRVYMEVKDVQLSFSYRGPFHDGLTERIVDISENTIADHLGQKKMNRKVSFLLVECFQNIIKHGEQIKRDPNETILDDGMFTFRSEGDSYFINSINVVRKDQIEGLSQTVALINSKTREELKEMYRAQLVNNELSDKGGAGLGLIEIARKSGNRLEVEFEPLDGDYALFHQQVFFSSIEGKTGVNQIERTKSLYKQLEESDLMMTYKGDFSQKSILPLLNIVESNIGQSKHEAYLAKKVGHVLIEMLQNIAKHAKGTNGAKDGIFTIGRYKDRFFVQTGNRVEETESKELSTRIKELQEMKYEELAFLHKEKIKESIYLEDKTRTGLGLIQIAKASTEVPRYSLTPYDGDMFYTLSVVV